MALSVTVQAQRPQAPTFEGAQTPANPGNEAEILEDPEEDIEETLAPRAHLGEPGLSGMLVDRTITMMGKTFFQVFSQRSLESTVMNNAHLSVYERPSARWGSLVWITEGNQIIFEATLPPRLSEIDRYAEAAADQVETRIIQRTISQALEQNEDLADEEL